MESILLKIDWNDADLTPEEIIQVTDEALKELKVDHKITNLSRREITLSKDRIADIIRKEYGFVLVKTGLKVKDQHVEEAPGWVAIPDIECALFEALRSEIRMKRPVTPIT